MSGNPLEILEQGQSSRTKIRKELLKKERHGRKIILLFFLVSSHFSYDPLYLLAKETEREQTGEQMDKFKASQKQNDLFER